MKKIRTQTAAWMLVLCLALCSPVNVRALSEVGSSEFFEERDLIARAVELTAPDGSYAARLAIAAVIVNRTADPRFPSEVRDVIYEDGAFDCVLSPNFETCQISYLSKTAARDALLGFDVTAGALYYKKGSMSDSEGACFHHSGFLFYKIPPTHSS